MARRWVGGGAALEGASARSRDDADEQWGPPPGLKLRSVAFTSTLRCLHAIFALAPVNMTRPAQGPATPIRALFAGISHARLSGADTGPHE